VEDTHKIARNGVAESSGHLPTAPRYSVSRAKIQPPNRYVAGENVAVLFCPAKNGLVFGVTIDRADLERVLPVGLWRVANNYPGGKRFRLYAYTFIYEAGQRKRVYLHRFVTSAPAGTEVDHGNHRGTDNRRAENLSVVSHQKNMMNQKRYRTTARITSVGGNYAEKEKQEQRELQHSGVVKHPVETDRTGNQDISGVRR
jgi:hypothetical protein